MYPIEYEAIIWNDDSRKYDKIHGITFGENYTQAMQNIEKYYGTDIVSIKLFMNEENSIYELEDALSDSDWHYMIKINGSIDTWDGC